MRNTAEQILDAIAAGFAAGGEDEWDAPEFQAARDLTEAAECQWDFMGWRDTADCIRNNGELGGVVLYDHTNEFHGTNESTYYVDSKGKTWWIYGVDNYPDSMECELLPSDAVEIDGSTVDDALIEHALEIERKHLRY